MVGRRASVALAVTVAFATGAAAGCSSSSSHASAPQRGGTTTTTAPAPPIPWTALQNPLLRDGSHAVKDPALVYAAGAWHALVSAVDRSGRWRIGLFTSRDLRQWSPLTTMPHDPAVEGEASPDAVPAPDGSWVVTFQSFVHDRNGARPKLYYRTTRDFVHFSADHLLAVTTHEAPNDRLIDAAVAYTPAGLLLGYKYGIDEQHFEIARSQSGTLAGPWTVIGRPNISVFGDTIENYQFLHLRGGWQLLATSNIGDYPFLFTLQGNPATRTGWLNWSVGRQLQVPLEPWNTGTGAAGSTFEHANCAFVVNRGPIDGEYYLVYSDSPNKSTFGGEGPAVVAIARSRDLVSWSVPPH